MENKEKYYMLERVLNRIKEEHKTLWYSNKLIIDRASFKITLKKEQYTNNQRIIKYT